MAKVELTQLIEAGAHFGHLTRRWNPKMRPFIFMEKNGIHIIDLKKTQLAIQQAAIELGKIVSDGGTVLFVGTKKQAKGVVAQEAKRCGMNWVSERWLGGMLTNFATIRKSISRMQKIDKMESDGTFEKITKKEQLFRTRERDKLRKILDGVETMKRMPNAIFIVDIKKESIAINEALRLNIPIFAIVDTNCNPDPVDYIVPSNDDAARAIELITKTMSDSIIEGSQKYNEVKAEKAAEREKLKKQEVVSSEEKKSGKPRIRKVKFNEKGERKDVIAKKGEKKPEGTKTAKVVENTEATKEAVSAKGIEKKEDNKETEKKEGK
jgi:small subunit ribosomal protein S2